MKNQRQDLYLVIFQLPCKATMTNYLCRLHNDILKDFIL